MDPQVQFCHNSDCPARGQTGLGNIRIHSRKKRRYRCTACNRTFAATCDTPFYRLKKPMDLVTIVLTLLCHGCPLQAIVAAFGLDERTVAAWRDRAGRHGQRFHEHHVLRGQVELGHVQADELSVKAVARRLWMAMAVPSRLWLGGVISPRRDLTLILAVVQMVRRAARGLAFLVCVNGLASYVTAFARVFRDPARTGRAGRPRLVPTAGLLLGQVVKQHAGRHVVGVTRRAVRGTAGAIAALLAATGTGTGINTAHIERLNATFRGALSPLARRGRAIARGTEALTAGMYLVGCADNFCGPTTASGSPPARASGSSGGSGPRRWRPGWRTGAGRCASG
ncbi:MAG: IS1 family transposase [Planctomycetaceae bacterium]|nr:IS1 family transposase [Planctomycetaceae bacterium]